MTLLVEIICAVLLQSILIQCAEGATKKHEVTSIDDIYFNNYSKKPTSYATPFETSDGRRYFTQISNYSQPSKQDNNNVEETETPKFSTFQTTESSNLITSTKFSKAKLCEDLQSPKLINTVEDITSIKIFCYVYIPKDCKINNIYIKYKALISDNPKLKKRIPSKIEVFDAIDSIGYNTFLISNLLPSTTYTFTMQSTTNEGSSEESEPVKIKTLIDIPGQVKNARIFNKTDKGFEIDWEGSENYGNSLSYIIEISFKPNHFIPATCQEKPVLFRHITEDTNYYFSYTETDTQRFDYNYSTSLRASNEFGEGEAVYLETVTSPVGGSSAVRDLSFSAWKDFNGDKYIMNGSLSWKHPCKPNGAILRFIYSYSGTYQLDPNITDTKSSYIESTPKESYEIFFEVMPYSMYTFEVVPDLNFSEPSSITFSTESNYAAAPIISIEENTTIHWENIDYPGPIFNYTLIVTPLHPPEGSYVESCTLPNLKTLNVTMSSTSFDLSETDTFHPYYEYNVTVFGTTEPGEGQKGSAILTTDPGVPEPPRQIETVCSWVGDKCIYDSKIEIQWENPCFFNGKPKDFQYGLFGVYSENDSFTESYPVKSVGENTVIEFNTILKPSFFYQLTIFTTIEGDERSDEVKHNFSTTSAIPTEPAILQIEEQNTSIVVIWEKPGNNPGPIINYKLNYKSLPDDTNESFNCELVDFKGEVFTTDQQYTIKNVPAYTKLEFKISAATSAGYSGSKSHIHRTQATAPRPLNAIPFTVKREETVSYKATAYISFDRNKCCPLTDEIINFDLVYNATRNNHETIEMTIVNLNLTSSYDLSLLPDYLYNIQIIINTRAGFSSPSAVETFLSPSGFPKQMCNFTLDYVEVDSTSVLFKLNRSMFDQEEGVIKYFAIILSKSPIETNSLNFWNTTWPPPVNDKSGAFYVTEPQWDPFQNTDDEVVTYSIGTGNECSNIYCNKGLNHETTYYLKVRAFTTSTFVDSNELKFQTGKNDSNLGMILGIIFSLISISILSIIVYYKRQKMKSWFKIKNSSNTETTFETNKTTENDCLFEEIINKSPEDIEKEFNEIQDISKEYNFSKEAAILDINRKKNRYTNISPYDKNRVLLASLESGDYINASYIKGYNSNYEYIATQGPLQHTTNEFWYMVYQENVTVIAMVTQYKENEKIKCYEYVPKKGNKVQLFENIQIETISEIIFDSYILTHISLVKDKEERIIFHMQYLKWPDFGTPESTPSILNYCSRFRECILKNPGKAVVHCSAGVGRTGTIIAIDILMQNVQNKTSKSIYETVLELRKQRTNMVQTLSQYTFIYSCVKNYIQETSSMNPLISGDISEEELLSQKDPENIEALTSI